MGSRAAAHPRCAQQSGRLPPAAGPGTTRRTPPITGTRPGRRRDGHRLSPHRTREDHGRLGRTGARYSVTAPAPDGGQAPQDVKRPAQGHRASPGRARTPVATAYRPSGPTRTGDCPAAPSRHTAREARTLPGGASRSPGPPRGAPLPPGAARRCRSQPGGPRPASPPGPPRKAAQRNPLGAPSARRTSTPFHHPRRARVVGPGLAGPVPARTNTCTGTRARMRRHTYRRTERAGLHTLRNTNCRTSRPDRPRTPASSQCKTPQRTPTRRTPHRSPPRLTRTGRPAEPGTARDNTNHRDHRRAATPPLENARDTTSRATDGHTPQTPTPRSDRTPAHCPPPAPSRPAAATSAALQPEIDPFDIGARHPRPPYRCCGAKVHLRQAPGSDTPHLPPTGTQTPSSEQTTRPARRHGPGDVAGAHIVSGAGRCGEPEAGTGGDHQTSVEAAR